MEHLDKAYDMLDRELEKIVGNGSITGSSVEMIDKLTHGMKNILTVEAMCDNGASGDWRNSYAQKRNARGQYSRDDGRDQLMHKIDELRNAVGRMG